MAYIVIEGEIGVAWEFEIWNLVALIENSYIQPLYEDLAFY